MVRSTTQLKEQRLIYFDKLVRRREDQGLKQGEGEGGGGGGEEEKRRRRDWTVNKTTHITTKF